MLSAAAPPARIFLTAETLRERVRQLGEQITADYQGREVVAVGVLRGIVFFNDLVRAIDLPLQIDYVALTPFSPGGVARLSLDVTTAIDGRHVLLVEDLVDTGLTLRFLTSRLRERQPASLRVFTLFDKPALRLAEQRLDYIGFTVPDLTLTGYGLDDRQQFRHSPDVWAVSPAD